MTDPTDEEIARIMADLPDVPDDSDLDLEVERVARRLKGSTTPGPKPAYVKTRAEANRLGTSFCWICKSSRHEAPECQKRPESADRPARPRRSATVAPKPDKTVPTSQAPPKASAPPAAPQPDPIAPARPDSASAQVAPAPLLERLEAQIFLAEQNLNRLKVARDVIRELQEETSS
jgi:hypothetical protein